MVIHYKATQCLRAGTPGQTATTAIPLNCLLLIIYPLPMLGQFWDGGF